MKVEFKKSVGKDVKKLTPEAQALVKGQFEALKKANSLGDMGNVIKMKGTKKPMYRLTIDDFRIMIKKLDNGIEVLSVSDRKDAYMKKNMIK